MKLSAKHLKAINWYSKENELKPQLSTPPTMYFRPRMGGDMVRADLSDIMKEYNTWNEADIKQRARERKLEGAKLLSRIGRKW